VTDSQQRLVSGPNWHINYSVHGTVGGSPVIFLHGGGPGATGLSNFSRNIDAFAKLHTCYVIDFPGWGKSSKNLEHFGAEGPFHNGGRALLAFMDALDITRAHLVGNSFGGSAALCLAMDHPERVDKLVLLGPGGGLVPGATGPTEGIVQLLTYYLGDGPSRDKLRAFLKNLVHDQDALTDDLLEQRFAASNDPEIIANPPLVPAPGGPSSAMFISTDPRLATLDHDALFVWGLQDRVNPWRGMDGFAAMAHADFVLFNQCGHWAQWEQSHKFNDLVLGFLADTRSPHQGDDQRV
jgi:4,5:9,10-diseco-3-hydroxy-5,9,17-trioxoandrosta-1(10),2-diene-4-oate hydrolase